MAASRSRRARTLRRSGAHPLSARCLRPLRKQRLAPWPPATSSASTAAQRACARACLTPRVRGLRRRWRAAAQHTPPLPCCALPPAARAPRRIKAPWNTRAGLSSLQVRMNVCAPGPLPRAPRHRHKSPVLGSSSALRLCHNTPPRPPPRLCCEPLCHLLPPPRLGGAEPPRLVGRARRRREGRSGAGGDCPL